MNRERHARVRDLFLAARDLPEAEREAYLQKHCGSDLPLRRDVELYLVGEGRDSTFLEPSATPPSPAALADRPTLIGSRSEPGDDARPTLPDHDLIKRIGGGAYGDVYLARNRHDEHYCAIKVVRRSSEGELEGIRRFKASVAEHPNLVPIEHVGKAADVVYIAMPLAENAFSDGPIGEPSDYVPMTLPRRIRRTGRIPAEEAAAIGHAIASGLYHMHTNGTIHGDVKPDNIFRIGPRWCLGDYGLVSDTDSRRPRGHTPGFMAPEGAGTPEADAFALGVTLLAMLGADIDLGPVALTDALRRGATSDVEFAVIDLAAGLIDADVSRRTTIHQAMETLGSMIHLPRGQAARGVRASGLVAAILCASIGVIAAPTIMLSWLQPPSGVLTGLAGVAFGFAGALRAGTRSHRRPHRVRQVLLASIGTVVCWSAYASVWSLCTLRPDPAWNNDEVYQIGFHMQPWTFREEAWELIEGQGWDPPEVAMQIRGWGGPTEIATVWKPWTIAAAGTLLILTYAAGTGCWVILIVSGFILLMPGRSLVPE